jgi:hypothetical protein
MLAPMKPVPPVTSASICSDEFSSGRDAGGLA